MIDTLHIIQYREVFANENSNSNDKNDHNIGENDTNINENSTRNTTAVTMAKIVLITAVIITKVFIIL